MIATDLTRGRIGLAVLFSIIVYLIFHQSSIPSHSFVPSDYIPNFARPSTQDWINRAIEVEVTDPFDLDAISRLCLNRQPRDDVIISCAPGSGGVGNVRSYVLHCIRFALEAGGSMIVPSFHRRSTTDISDMYGPPIDFEHLFDREHLISTIQTACPHITVYEHPNENMTMANVQIPFWEVAVNSSTPNSPSPWRVEFDKWMEGIDASMKRPVIIESGDPGRAKVVMADGMDFYYNFGRVLKFRPDVRRLAAVCLAELKNRFKLKMDPTNKLFPNAFMGAHLRTSIDAVKAGWNPDFDEQTDRYINQTLAHGLKIIFAASGNEADLIRFAEKGLKHGIIVVNKKDLLSGNDLRELHNLFWDQRGLVDFEILLKASNFGGFSPSSFSTNIALRRHFWSKVADPLADPNDFVKDDLSIVYGKYEGDWETEVVKTMWP